MKPIKILTMGKVRERWLQLALDEYLKRLQPLLPLEIVLVKNNHQLMSFAARERRVIALDERGEQLGSVPFADQLEEGLTFLIGGADGLPPHDYPTLGLSRMTFTHQMARLLLVEQLYRAALIKQGSPYHRA